MSEETKFSDKGRRCRLGNCPPGLFRFGDIIGFKSEYMTPVDGASGTTLYQSDAYCVASGEYFWGGATSAEKRERLMVQPLAA